MRVKWYAEDNSIPDGDICPFGNAFLGGCGQQESKKITSIERLNDPAYTIGVPEGG